MKIAMSKTIKLLVVSGMLITLFACGSAEDRKTAYFEKGKSFLQDKNYDKARLEFKNVLQIDPKFAPGYYNLGILEEENKEMAKAVANYKKAIELDPAYTDAKIKLARIYVVSGSDSMLDEASKLIEQVKQEDPGNAQSELMSAMIEYKSGSRERARSRLESILLNKPALVDGVGLLSAVYIAEGEDQKAIQLLKKGVADNPDSVYLRIELAKILAKNNRLAEAESYLKEAIQVDSEDYLLKVALAMFYANKGDLDDSISVLKDAINKKDDDPKRYRVLIDLISARQSLVDAERELLAYIDKKPDLYDLKFDLVSLYQKMGKISQAKEILKKIISDKEYDAEGTEARDQLAAIFLQEGDQALASQYIKEVLDQFPNNEKALLLNGKLALKELDPEAAINSLRVVVKNNPVNTEAAFLLAQAHELKGENNIAENVLRRSIEDNPVDERTHLNYVRFLMAKGRGSEALAVLDKAIGNFKDNYELLKARLQITARSGDQRTVLSLLDQMENVRPQADEVNLLRGQLFASLGKQDEALEQFELAYQKSGERFEPLENITNYYLRTNQHDKALDRLGQRLDKLPSDPFANYLMGRVNQSLGKSDMARDYYSQAIKYKKDWVLAYNALASTYVEKKEFDRAIDIFKEGLQNVRNNLNLQMSLASIYELKKDYASAMGVYETLLESNSGNVLARNNYAALLLDYGKAEDAKKALDLLSGFENLDQPAFRDTLAWAYAKTGGYAKAVELLTPIVKRAPEVAAFRYHLGYALYNMGDKQSAKVHLDVAANSEQSFPGKQNVESMLNTI